MITLGSARATAADACPGFDRAAPAEVELARAAEAGTQGQLGRLAGLQAGRAGTAPAAWHPRRDCALVCMSLNGR